MARKKQKEKPKPGFAFFNEKESVNAFSILFEGF